MKKEGDGNDGPVEKLWPLLPLWVRRKLSPYSQKINAMVVLLGFLFGFLPILIGAVTYVVEIPQRENQANNAAWQVITAAEGQRATGGRIEALQDLNENRCLGRVWCHHRVSLRGLAATNNAILQGVILKDADLRDAHLEADLEGASFVNADLRRANLQNAFLEDVDFRGADLEGAILVNAYLEDTDFRGTKNLTPGQIKACRNWEEGIYDEDMRIALGLPPK